MDFTVFQRSVFEIANDSASGLVETAHREVCIMSVEEHKAQPPSTARCVILCISDSIHADHNPNADLIESLLHEKGHEVVYHRIIKNKPGAIQEAVCDAIADEESNAIITTGGTGISRKDVTFTSLVKLFQTDLPGFGELFRYLSYLEIGSAALLSRATAGIIDGHPVFILPGSTGAVRLAMEKLILPELGHVLNELHK